MSIKALIGSEVASQVRAYPKMYQDKNGNILLFKDVRTSTIIYSKREENIGIQYYDGEYLQSNLKLFEGTLSLENAKEIAFD